MSGQMLELWRGGQMHLLVPLSVVVDEELVILTVPCEKHGDDIVGVVEVAS